MTTYKCDHCGFDFEINEDNTKRIIKAIKENIDISNNFGCKHCQSELIEIYKSTIDILESIEKDK